MTLIPLKTLLHDWEQETLTTEQTVEQMLQHLLRLYRQLGELQTAYHSLERQVKQRPEEGSHG